jgi:hypothetical protein
MLGKFFDRVCFNTLFLVAAVFILGVLQVSSFFSAEKGAKMAGPNPILPKTVGLWTRPDSPKLVTAENIFAYMNGAGELYLGYRFDHLDVYEYQAESQKEILVEIYTMKTSDDAFGLLSLDWGGDPVGLVLDSQGAAADRSPWPRALYGQGLLRLWTQNIYARVMATQETPESREAILTIGHAIVKDRRGTVPPEPVNMLKEFLSPDFILRKDRVSFFRTHLVLNSLYYLSHENILDLDLECQAIAAEYEKKESPGERAWIQIIHVDYPDAENAKQALAGFHQAYLAEHPFSGKTDLQGNTSDAFAVEDGWMAYRLHDTSIAFVFECPDENTAREILEYMCENYNKRRE